ncbi:hypothetical protein [Parasediminibacterium sp. JCM 36343]|uniref:hypothetical protein n=1 Tax=Parasediminibacterium sp. JCM 36343 TaxID=3374279 RepID=UPI00397E03E6
MLFFFAFQDAAAQAYNALNGSAYGGVLSNFTNPASAINTPFNWDISILGWQTNTANNAASISNLITANLNKANIKKIIVQPTEGYSSRSIDNDADFHLLNYRHNIGTKGCFSIGLRARSYTHAVADPFSYTNTISGLYPFLQYNAYRSSTPFNASIYNEAWLETNISYAVVLQENEGSRLTGGITLGLLRGLSGIYGAIDNLTYKTSTTGIHSPTSNTGIIALYSANYSVLDERDGDLQNILHFKSAAKLSIGASIGLEYLVKENVVEEAYSPDHYALKIGVSIMDIGQNRFSTGKYSFRLQNPKANATDTGFVHQLATPTVYGGAKEIIGSKFNDTFSLAPSYTMSLPTRLVLSIDKPLGDNFYINGMATVNFYQSNASDMYKIKTNELSRIAVMARWETEKWGAYMPVQYTAMHQILVGAAIKLGPLLMGLHNINWLQRTKLEELNGGGYFALHFTPPIRKRHHQWDCYDGPF